MFGKVKKWLGIEGVKVELMIPDVAFKQVGVVSGKLLFYSKYPQKVTSIKLRMLEKYTRGRGEDKRIDEYEIGEITLTEGFEVPSEKPLSIDFTLPFSMLKSEMDEMEEKGFVRGGIVKVAKMLRKVKSEYFILAEATVEGTALNPFDKKVIDLKP